MNADKVDFLLVNAKLYTVNPDFEVAGGMAVRDGRIVDVGPAAALQERWAPAHVVDGGGHCVYPGFIDPHSHLLGYSAKLGMADLVGARSWDEVIERLRDQQRRHPTPWALGRGWDQNGWPGRAYPTRDLLDRAFPDQPAFLVRVDGHAAVANGAALALAGLDEASRVPGGELFQAAGRLTGVLIDNAIDLVKRVVPQADRATREQALLTAQANCFAVGLTSVCDAGVDRDDALLLDAMHRDGRLKLRVYAMLNPTGENYAHFLARGVQLTNRLTIRCVKTYADGALGSRGALLLAPYADDPGNRGLQLASSQALDDICRRAARAGYQVATHCIGDAAVRLMLGIYGRHLEPGNDARWRIEHAQTVDSGDLPAFGARGIVPSVQTTHATSDMVWAAERLGPRIKCAYRYQELLRQNGWLPNGSDFPVEDINPLFGFYAGVARKDLRGHPAAGFQMENALTREQALRAMTIWAARANFEEASRGSLEAGKWADFVILDRDLMHAPEAELPSARVLATFSAGEQVHGGETKRSRSDAGCERRRTG
jgi:predicted amidohydrolase YtcJ